MSNSKVMTNKTKAFSRKKLNSYLLEILAIVIFIVFFFPLVLMVINSFKENSFLVTSDPLGLTGSIESFIKNLSTVWSSPNTMFQRAFINSTIITVFSLALIVITSSMAGWILVRTKSLTSTVIFYMFVVAMIIPFQVVMLPLVSWFRIIRDFSAIPLLRTHFGLIFAYIAFGAPFSVFLYHGFVKSIPYELEEAAKIDGCNTTQTFFYIVFPILKPVTITVLILNGIWIWNDFLLPLLIIGKGTDNQTIPLAIANYAGAFVTEYQLLLTAVLLAMVPVLILFLFAQKYIIKGMVAGSIK
jgi:raffinose/stachyose/melibiose transport system permease protein